MLAVNRLVIKVIMVMLEVMVVQEEMELMSA